MKMKLFLLTFVALNFSNICHADSKFKVFTSKNPPYVENIGSNEKDSKGIAIEIILGALTDAHIDFNFPDNNIPWKRSQLDTENTENSLLVPLTKTKERENKYQWISVIFEDQLGIYGIPTSKPLANLEELKKADVIGVFAGGGAYNSLIDLGVKEPPVHPVKSEEQNLMMLLTNRLNYWAIQAMKEKYIVDSSLEPQAKTIKQILSVSKTQLWAVTSKKTPQAEVEKLRQAIEAFKTTPKYNSIIARYQNKQ